jgi:sterol 3beta-glucosyltransferase
MRILVTSIGTRGDMEPFLAIGEILKAKGHEVICQFPEQFRKLAEQSGFGFRTLGPEFMEMLESDTGKFAMGGGGAWWKKMLAFIKLAKLQKENNKLMIQRQRDAVDELKPDRIVHNGKVMYPVIWEVNNKGKTIFISPVPFLHYVKGHTHVAFHSNYGTFLNKLTFKLADWGLLKTISASLQWLNITNISKGQIKAVLQNHKVIYTISPQLLEKPDYWAENLKVLGFHERDKTIEWQPDEQLLTFLNKHQKIIFITFGSMINPKPEQKTQAILNILERNKIPAIINTSSGGLIKPVDFKSDLIHFVSGIPYDWIFPKMYGIIHHGGSGTTHMTLKHGCASLIIPHIIDQYVWNDIAASKGAGPKGMSIGKLTEQKLEPLVLDLINNKSYKEKAEELGEKMRLEDFREVLYNEIVH